MKRFAILITTIALLLNINITITYAIASESGTSTQKKVMFNLKPDISVEVNGVRQIFKNVDGQYVYPIIYNGTVYLPIRAVSAVMKEPIEWDSGSKTVYIGKTLSYPVKSSAPIPTNAAISAGERDMDILSELKPSLVMGSLKSEIFVMYDFEILSFQDVNGATIYPLNYDGTTYLPVRSISNLMDRPITWNSTTSKISINNGEAEEAADAETKEEDSAEVDATAALFKNLYEREEALYYEASAKVTNIKNATADEKKAIAASASDNYLKAQAITTEVKAIKEASLTEAKKIAYEKLLVFAESNEYYLLVLENVAYLAASDSDYSMLADTFLYFALDAQTKMEEARELIIKEPVYN